LNRLINKPGGHPKSDGCRHGFGIPTADAGAIFHLTQFFHGSGFQATRPVTIPNKGTDSSAERPCSSIAARQACVGGRSDKEKNLVHKILEVTDKHEISVILVNKFSFVKR
jgi:hypothetical protein